MSKGKRYETEGKLNYQKVIAVILAIIVLIMFIFIIRNVFAQKEETIESSAYYALYASDKWGVINQAGQTIIEPSYQEMIVIPDETKEVFLYTYDINEETGEYKTKAINSKNEAIFTDYEQVEPIINYDENNQAWYEKNILKVKKDGKYGLINLNGTQLLACEYEEITALQGIENSILIKKDGKFGLANDTGSILIEPNFTEIKNLGKTYKEGYITINQDGKYGVVSTTKMQLLENKYDEIKPVYLPNYFLVIEAGTLKVINSSGETILQEGFDDIKSETSKGFIFTKNNLYGEISKSGEILIEAKYQDLKEAKDGDYIAKQNEKYGIIDSVENIQLAFDYTAINYNETANLYIAEKEDLNTYIIGPDYQIKITGILSELNEEKQYIKMRIEDDYKYFNFNCEEKANTEILNENTLFLSKQDGKYGFINKTGDVVVDYIYDDATEQNIQGYAGIKKDGLWGSIDKEGNIVIEPKYNLDNNFIINFIGKWHLGQDINMNYYCEK